MLHVDDVDALYEEFVRCGALIKQAPADKPHGMREFSVATPDGHRLMIGQDLGLEPEALGIVVFALMAYCCNYNRAAVDDLEQCDAARVAKRDHQLAQGSPSDCVHPLEWKRGAHNREP
ncbi:VOC family protein [Variovorax paradoxus]|uniref:VOC family protein n=1 Tax=Variovorax paradoxus TaxID=34073 RepID=UPI000379111F|nr:VOC family protein [Variovorax paradoxus]